MAGIRKKDQKIMDRIIECVEDYYSDYNSSPSIQYIATELEISKSTVHRYLMEMHEKGLVEYSSKCIKTERIKKQDNRRVRVPILGNISCGTPEFAEEDFEEYVSLPVSLFGDGDFFILRTHGDSMIEKGIDVICDVIVSVVASENVRLKRIMNRDGITEIEARQRINAQFSEEFFRANSDYIIENSTDGGLEQKTLELIAAVKSR